MASSTKSESPDIIIIVSTLEASCIALIVNGISADLSSLKIGEVYDFAYSLRDARFDSITTLTMVHDMQTNIVFMSISPTDDSLSQSYTSDSFDPKLFEFPD